MCATTTDNIESLQRLLREERESQERRQAALAAAQSRVDELEAQIEAMTGQAAVSAMPEPMLAAKAKAADAEAAARALEEAWAKALQTAQQRDEAFVKRFSFMGQEMDNLEVVNQRLSSLAQKLRERQEAMARRIAELEALAGETPQLRSELKALAHENEGLKSEIERLEKENEAIEKRVARLKEEIKELRAQPASAELMQAQAQHDRQIVKLLRDQNQRLIFELEEAREEIDASQRRAKKRGEAEELITLKDRCNSLELENNQILAQYEAAQKSLSEKEALLAAMERKLAAK